MVEIFVVHIEAFFVIYKRAGAGGASPASDTDDLWLRVLYIGLIKKFVYSSPSQCLLLLLLLMILLLWLLMMMVMMLLPHM